MISPSATQFQANGYTPSYLSQTDPEDVSLIRAIRVLQKPLKHRDWRDHDQLTLSLSSITFLQNLQKEFGKDIHRECINALYYETYPVGHVMFRQGDPGHEFYIILKGRIGIEIAMKTSVPQEDGTLKTMYVDQEVGDIGTGSAFGELALLNDKPRSATCVCKDETHFAVLTKSDYKKILAQEEKRKFKAKFEDIASFPIFKDAVTVTLSTMIYHFTMVEYAQNKPLFREGEDSNFVYFIKTGDWKMTKEIFLDCEQDERLENFISNVIFKNRVKRVVELAVFGPGEIIGLEEVMNDKKREFSVNCLSLQGSAYVISKADLKKRLYGAANEAFLQVTNRYVASHESWLTQRIKDLSEKTEGYKNLLIACQHRFFYPKKPIIEKSPKKILSTSPTKSPEKVGLSSQTSFLLPGTDNDRKSTTQRPRTAGSITRLDRKKGSTTIDASLNVSITRDFTNDDNSKINKTFNIGSLTEDSKFNPSPSRFKDAPPSRFQRVTYNETKGELIMTEVSDKSNNSPTIRKRRGGILKNSSMDSSYDLALDFISKKINPDANDNDNSFFLTTVLDEAAFRQPKDRLQPSKVSQKNITKTSPCSPQQITRPKRTYFSSKANSNATSPRLNEKFEIIEKKSEILRKLGDPKRWDLVKFMVDCNKKDSLLKHNNRGSTGSGPRRAGHEFNTSAVFNTTMFTEVRPNTAETQPASKTQTRMRPSTAPQKVRASSEGAEDFNRSISSRPVTRDGKASIKAQSLHIIEKSFKDNSAMLKIVQRLYPNVCSTTQIAENVPNQGSQRHINSSFDGFKTSTTPLWARMRSSKHVRLSSNQLPIKSR